jgi:hypothetical protein
VENTNSREKRIFRGRHGKSVFIFFCFTHISCGNVQGRVIILWSSGLRCFSIKLGGRNEKNHSPLHYKSNGRSTNVSGGAPLNNLNIEIHSICTYPIVHELAYLFKHLDSEWFFVLCLWSLCVDHHCVAVEFDYHYLQLASLAWVKCNQLGIIFM